MQKNFSKHGCCNISHEENIIMMDAEGPWNDEFFVEMHHKLLGVVGQIDINNYAILVTLIGESIATSDSLITHENHVKSGNAKAIAFNLAYCDTPLITEMMFTKIYNSNNLKNKFFNDTASAKSWLKGYLD